jgi:cob(I)alamin adenosyltransferase
LDELGAFLGDARALARGEIAETIRLIQRELISLSGVLANPRGEAPAGWPGAARLEEWIAQREAAASCGGFVLSGDNPLAAKFHIARTVCRRAERRLVTLDWREGVPPPVIRYINRLSDLLFLMAQETLEG